MLKGKSSDGFDEATAALQAIAGQLAGLRQRRAAAEQSVEDQRAIVERERAAYRKALATADPEDDRTTRAALDRAETDLRRAEDVVAGCAEAIRELEPDWKGAKIRVLKVENVRDAAEVQTLQAQLDDLGVQIERLRREQSDVGFKIGQLAGARARREAEIGELLRELAAAR